VAVALATGELGILATLVALPLAAAGRLSWRATAAAGGTAVVLALLAAIPHDPFDAPHTTALIALGIASVMAVELAAEREAREREAAFATFLGDAGTLLACSLDFDVTAKAVASVPVPELADWCLVEILAWDGAVERRAASHPNPGAEQLAACIAQAGDEDRAPRTQLWPELPDALLDTWSNGNGDRLDAMRAVGARAAMRLPLRTPERTLGSMTLLARDSSRRYREADLRLAEELAARCTLAIENAQAYRAARRPAERRFGRRAEPPPAPVRHSDSRDTDPD
jgi:hypothetical protein